MEIIESGKKREIVNFYTVRCSCGCLFKFSADEIKSLEKRPDGNGTVICPECGNEVTFSPRDNWTESKFRDQLK